MRKYISQPGAVWHRCRDALSERLLRSGAIKGRTDYQKFIVLGWYRTGSNLLINSLSSHPMVVSYSELFHLPRIFWADAVFGLGESNPVLLHRRNESPSAFLSEYVFRKYPAHIRAVGFKIFYPHMEEPIYGNMTETIHNIDGLRVIHLMRRNLFDVFVSKEIAARRKIMTEVSAKKARKGLMSLGKLHFEIKEVENFFIALTERMVSYKTLVKREMIRELYYEDLVSDYDAQLEKIQHFLQLPVRKLHSVLIKQNTLPHTQLVSNYRELCSYFRNTEWASFFQLPE